MAHRYAAGTRSRGVRHLLRPRRDDGHRENANRGGRQCLTSIVIRGRGQALPRIAVSAQDSGNRRARSEEMPDPSAPAGHIHAKDCAATELQVMFEDSRPTDALIDSSTIEFLINCRQSSLTIVTCPSAIVDGATRERSLQYSSVSHDSHPIQECDRFNCIANTQYLLLPCT